MEGDKVILDGKKHPEDEGRGVGGRSENPGCLAPLACRPWKWEVQGDLTETCAQGFHDVWRSTGFYFEEIREPWILNKIQGALASVTLREVGGILSKIHWRHPVFQGNMLKNVLVWQPALYVAEQRFCIHPVILRLADLRCPLAVCLLVV